MCRPFMDFFSEKKNSYYNRSLNFDYYLKISYLLQPIQLKFLHFMITEDRIIPLDTKAKSIRIIVSLDKIYYLLSATMPFDR